MRRSVKQSINLKTIHTDKIKKERRKIFIWEIKEKEIVLK